jgi:hypothetical protein
MRRREFIAALGGAAAWPLMARGQQPTAVIGFLGPASATGFAPYLKGFRRGYWTNAALHLATSGGAACVAPCNE